MKILSRYCLCLFSFLFLLSMPALGQRNTVDWQPLESSAFDFSQVDPSVPNHQGDEASEDEDSEDEEGLDDEEESIDESVLVAKAQQALLSQGDVATFTRIIIENAIDLDGLSEGVLGLAYFLARRSENLRVLVELQGAGGTSMTESNNLCTFLRLAINAANPQIARLLVGAGADIFARDSATGESIAAAGFTIFQGLVLVEVETPTAEQMEIRAELDFDRVNAYLDIFCLLLIEHRGLATLNFEQLLRFGCLLLNMRRAANPALHVEQLNRVFFAIEERLKQIQRIGDQMLADRGRRPDGNEEGRSPTKRRRLSVSSMRGCSAYSQ